MEREIRTTQDGSKTLYIKDLNENYHSHHGALQEANHVFIKNGLNLVNYYEINILELGFGTGLNALVTINDFLKNDKNHVINYFTVEKYPVNIEEVSELDYGSSFEHPEIKDFYEKLHQCPWNEKTEILSGFFFTKFQCDFFDIENLTLPKINLVYYDCFGARVQPDLWEEKIFKIVSNTMENEGLITTYSSKGSVRRILKDLNFEVEKKAGPPGKREMMIATKRSHEY
ncbi:MAG TPA: tRNA (5-methylaminomethyl-2-thiouridine)(34)-methyltransferase MnmD [Kaistella chaponensis]|nr:tRNA (5-methylaminomethyl-2-thiouridine)(34)-methyltransferase MnmD [Kaistella chaponensis]